MTQPVPATTRTIPDHRKPILVVNESSGEGEVPYEAFGGFEVVEIEDAASTIAFADLPPDTLVAVWGGDGTCRAIAQLMIGTDSVLLPCPGGTHNHFAAAANVATIDDVTRAISGRDTIDVDIGIAGEQVFLNNANFGWYVDLVKRRQRYGRVMPRKLAKALSLVVQLGRTRRWRVIIDGEAERVWMVWIGNGRFSMSPTEPMQRDDLGDNDTHLDVRLLRAGNHVPKLRAFLAMLSGHAEESAALDRRIVRRCSLTFRESTVTAALDGELIELRSPLEIGFSPGRLRIAVPGPAVSGI